MYKCSSCNQYFVEPLRKYKTVCEDDYDEWDACPFCDSEEFVFVTAEEVIDSFVEQG